MAGRLRYRAQIDLHDDTGDASALIESRVEGPHCWRLYGPGKDDPFDGELLAEGECVDLADGVLDAIAAFAFRGVIR